MHSILEAWHPPTVVDHAVKCNFFNNKEINLVTASSSLLTVYHLYLDSSKKVIILCFQLTGVDIRKNLLRKISE